MEVQSVYISGNVTHPFNHYMDHRNVDPDFTWEENVRPDYLSSSRKRLTPQLIYKGGIIREWQKKLAVAIQDSFFATMPELPTVSPPEADIAWFIYKLEHEASANLYHLVRDKVVYTRFKPALDKITTAPAGDVNEFLARLRKKLEEEKQVYPPINLTLFDPPVEE